LTEDNKQIATSWTMFFEGHEGKNLKCIYSQGRGGLKAQPAGISKTLC